MISSTKISFYLASYLLVIFIWILHTGVSIELFRIDEIENIYSEIDLIMSISLDSHRLILSLWLLSMLNSFLRSLPNILSYRFVEEILKKIYKKDDPHSILQLKLNFQFRFHQLDPLDTSIWIYDFTYEIDLYCQSPSPFNTLKYDT